MTTGLVEWTVRMVMLVLAGMVTLAIPGSISVMSSEGGTGVSIGQEALRPAGEPAPSQPIARRDEPAIASPDSRAAAGAEAGANAAASTAGSAAPATAPDDRDRWMEAIAYALLAIAGLLALLLLLIGRALRHLRLIAERPETPSRTG